MDYLDSWVSTDLAVCYQLMHCADPSLLNSWIARWSDLVEFEIVPVISSLEAARRVAG